MAGRRPGTSGVDRSAVWSRVEEGAAGRRIEMNWSNGVGGGVEISRVGVSRITGAARAAKVWATNVSRLPQKVRQLPPAPAKPVVNWRSDTRGRSYGAVEGAVQGQPLATSEELRRWGFI